MATKTKLAICWLQPEQWEQAQAVFEDKDNFEMTYEEWRKNANNAVTDITAKGHIAIKVKVDLNEMLEWAKENDKPMNAQSRAEFTGIKVQTKANKN